MCKEAGMTAKVIGTQILQLYANLLFNESCQLWDKIVKAQTKFAPWEDLKGEVHGKKGGKILESFLYCVTFHFLTMFWHNSGKAVIILHLQYPQKAKSSASLAVLQASRAA